MTDILKGILRLYDVDGNLTHEEEVPLELRDTGIPYMNINKQLPPRWHRLEVEYKGLSIEIIDKLSNVKHVSVGFAPGERSSNELLVSASSCEGDYTTYINDPSKRNR